MPNATDLTDRYRGREPTFWTPCIHDYLEKHRPCLPIAHCVSAEEKGPPYYRERRDAPQVDMNGAQWLAREPSRDAFLGRIEAAFDMPGLSARRPQSPPKGDIAGIEPDLCVVLADRGGVLFLENKPYYGSQFDGNQGPDGAYCSLVQWLTRVGVPCQYLVICPISWDRGYQDMLRIQQALDSRFGVLLLEDVFAGMQKAGFNYGGISDWGTYADKGEDFA